MEKARSDFAACVSTGTVGRLLACVVSCHKYNKVCFVFVMLAAASLVEGVKMCFACAGACTLKSTASVDPIFGIIPYFVL